VVVVVGGAVYNTVLGEAEEGKGRWAGNDDVHDTTGDGKLTKKKGIEKEPRRVLSRRGRGESRVWILMMNGKTKRIQNEEGRSFS